MAETPEELKSAQPSTAEANGIERSWSVTILQLAVPKRATCWIMSAGP
jgi:hypothetical protein